MSNLINHAKRELALTGEEQAVVNSYLSMLRVFSKMGHSGASAEYAIATLHRLLHFRNLTELTDSSDEWIMHDPAVWDGVHPIWQSTRNTEAFSKNGGRTYYLLAEVKPKHWWRRDSARYIYHTAKHVMRDEAYS